MKACRSLEKEQRKMNSNLKAASSTALLLVAFRACGQFVTVSPLNFDGRVPGYS